MVKKKTPKNKSPRKIYIGGQQTIKNIFTEGNNLYNSEISSQNNKFSLEANDILFFIENFYQDLQKQYNDKEEEIFKSLQTYGQEYTSYFTLINAILKSNLAEAKELVDFTRNINDEFQNQNIHVHLINKKFSLLSNARLQTNNINKIFQNSLNTLNSIFETIKKDYPVQQISQQQRISDIETQTHKLQDAISIVNRPLPNGFIPRPNTIFIQGCPLGTILEGDLCKYYSDISNTNLLESVPLQKDLISGDYVIWFNKLNQINSGTPTIFKKKQIQSLLKLSDEDSILFGVKYIVSQDNGIPFKDNNGFYKFVSDIQYGWNQDSATITNTPGNNFYYIDYDGTPQPVKVLENSSPILRNNETKIKYVSAVSPNNTIINGIQYVETDLSGNLMLDLSNNYIPFYPNYYEYSKKNNIFSKKSYNNVDIFTYELLPNSIILTIDKAILDLSSFDKFSYNQISTFYKNKFTEISIPEYYSPFVLPTFFSNDGDYYLIKNTGNIPIIFNLSKIEDEKRLVIYPKQIVCFISSSKSANLSYGFLNLDTNISLLSSTKNVALVKPDNVYAFVETKPLYDNGNYIMQQIVPLLDTEGNIIAVPNFDESKMIYYEYDDIYLTNPIQVTIVTSEIKVVDDKTYTSMNYPNASYSPLNIPYISKYICATNYGNIFVFCNENNIPNIDVLGYLIPVPSPIYYTNNSYAYFSMDKEMPVEIKLPYNGAGFVNNYDYSSQLQTQYYSICQKTNIYTNKQANPIIYNNRTFIISSSNTNPTNINVHLPIGFQMIEVDIKKKEFEMKNIQETNRNKIYIQNTNVLLEHYKDLSGSMNNLKELSIDLNTNIQQMVLATDLDKLNEYDILVKNTYNQILDTQTKLQTYEKDQQAKQALIDEINKYKIIRNNELTIIKAGLINITNQLSSIKAIDSISENDLNLLKNTLDKLKSSFNIVNVNIDSSNDLIFIQDQEKSTQILLKGIQTLQNNINYYRATILEKQQTINAKDLEEKQKDLQSLSSTILQTPIDILNSQLNNLPLDSNIDTIKQNIKTSIENIKNIIDDVKNNTIVTYTNDTINTQIGKYQNDINAINLEKQNIQNYLQQAQDTLSKKNSQELLTLKTTLQQNILSYQNEVLNIRNLLNTLPLSLDQKTAYESQLNNTNLEVQTIYTNLPNLNNVPETKSDISRVNEISSLTKNILTQLQTIQLKTMKGGRSKKSIKSLLIRK